MNTGDSVAKKRSGNGPKLLPYVFCADGKMYVRIFLEDRKSEDRELSLDSALVLMRQLAQAMQEARR